MTKASDNEYPSVLFDEQGSDPSTPASGFWRAYFKSTGMFVIDDAATVTGPLGAGGGGGITQAFAGYNTVGASWATVVLKRQYCKKITLANACLLTSVDCYIRPSTDNVTGLVATVLADNSNAPGVLIAAASGATGAAGMYFSNSASMPGAGRWFTSPIGAWLASGDYWICFQAANTNFDIAYDSGTDRIFTSSLVVATGAYPSAWSITTTSESYSIRANTIR